MSVPCHERPPATKGHFSSEPAVAGRGRYYCSMKIARVIPLFKTGNTKEFSNYRPISLLPQFSKILEKNYHSRLMAFIDSNQILYKSQYGFRKQMSTSLAIIELVEEITNSLDNQLVFLLI